MSKVAVPNNVAGDDSTATETSSSVDYEEEQNRKEVGEKEDLKSKVEISPSKKDFDEEVNDYWFEPPIVTRPPKGAQHGRGGVFYGGNWVDIEDCVGTFVPKNCQDCPSKKACPRSMTRNAAESIRNSNSTIYDIVIIGAGCIGGAVARELSKYQLKILWLEAADDVSQGATKGNSGIVHAGYDDKPGTNRAKYCWKGNQMFSELDKDLRFGYQKNGSLVVAFNETDMDHLKELKKRGQTNGVEKLRIVYQQELREMEPHINPDAVGALYSSEAGNVIPYEYAIALAENAVDNGVELRIRREVQAIKEPASDAENWELTVRHWEPAEYIKSSKNQKIGGFKKYMTIPSVAVFVITSIALGCLYAFSEDYILDAESKVAAATILGVFLGGSVMTTVMLQFFGGLVNVAIPNHKDFGDMKKMVERAGRAIGLGGIPVNLSDMLIGGSGSSGVQQGVTVETEKVRARFIINCAGGASDQIAKMIGDDSFKIKPRIGDYILLNRNQGHLANQTLFPCPDPKLGKGVLVQTTLWSNLILGPTARDMHDNTAKGMGPKEIQEYILSKCKNLVPSFDAKETIHTFCGARAKSDRGDWIIEPSKVNKNMIHVAGIDSPGLAGSPAIALEVVRLLKAAGMDAAPNPNFNPTRAPIITPKKVGLKGLKMGPAGKNDSDGKDEAKMAANVICKCERVTELEVVRALRRSLPIDSTQAIRKRTRAGMGHCQGDPDNYNCEARVKAIIARETGEPLDNIGGRPWPATSILTKRWIDEEDKKELKKRMMAA